MTDKEIKEKFAGFFLPDNKNSLERIFLPKAPYDNPPALQTWLPTENGKINLRYSSNLKGFKYEKEGSGWNIQYINALEKCEMKPDQNGKLFLTNKNREVNEVVFGTNDTNWKIIEWITYLARRSDLGVTSLEMNDRLDWENKDDDLVIDQIKWKHTEGDESITRTGWTAYPEQ